MYVSIEIQQHKESNQQQEDVMNYAKEDATVGDLITYLIDKKYLFIPRQNVSVWDSKRNSVDQKTLMRELPKQQRRTEEFQNNEGTKSSSIYKTKLYIEYNQIRQSYFQFLPTQNKITPQSVANSLQKYFPNESISSSKSSQQSKQGQSSNILFQSLQIGVMSQSIKDLNAITVRLILRDPQSNDNKQYKFQAKRYNTLLNLKDQIENYCKMSWPGYDPQNEKKVITSKGRPVKQHRSFQVLNMIQNQSVTISIQRVFNGGWIRDSY